MKKCTKTDDLTCGNCLYGSLQMDGVDTPYVECRYRSVKSPIAIHKPTYWCSEGRWFIEFLTNFDSELVGDIFDRANAIGLFLNRVEESISTEDEDKETFTEIIESIKLFQELEKDERISLSINVSTLFNIIVKLLDVLVEFGDVTTGIGIHKHQQLMEEVRALRERME
jgi:hypothetical protein